MVDTTVITIALKKSQSLFCATDRKTMLITSINIRVSNYVRGYYFYISIPGDISSGEQTPDIQRQSACSTSDNLFHA
jgi:hypothetical protein